MTQKLKKGGKTMQTPNLMPDFPIVTPKFKKIIFRLTIYIYFSIFCFNFASNQRESGG